VSRNINTDIKRKKEKNRHVETPFSLTKQNKTKRRRRRKQTIQGRSFFFIPRDPHSLFLIWIASLTAADYLLNKYKDYNKQSKAKLYFLKINSFVIHPTEEISITKSG